MVLTAGVMLLYRYVPVYLGDRLLPQLAAAAGIDGISGSFSHLGLFDAEYHQVRLRLKGRRVIAADSIRIGYRLPLWPFRKQLEVRELTIFGARVNVVRDGDHWRIPGLYPDLVGKAAAPAEGSATGTSRIALNLRQLYLNRCSLRVENAPGRVWEFPFTLRLVRTGAAAENISAFLKLQCAGDAVRGRFDWNRTRGNLRLRGEISPDHYFPAGQAPVRGQLDFTADIFGIMPHHGERRLDGIVRLTPSLLTAGGWQLTPASAAVSASSCELRFTMSQPGLAEFSWSGPSIRGPVSWTPGRGRGRVTWDERTVVLNGTGEGVIGNGLRPELKWRSPLPVRQQLTVEWDRRAAVVSWHGRVTTLALPDTAPAALLTPYGVCLPGRLQVEGTGKFRLQPLPHEDDLTAQLQLVSAPGLGWAVGERSGRPGREVIVVERPQLEFTVARRQGQWQGGLTAVAAALRLPGAGLTVGDTILQLPLPGRNGVVAVGRLELARLCWRRKPLTDVVLTGKIGADRLVFTGRLQPKILPGAPWDCRLELQWRPEFCAAVALDFGPYALAEPLRPGTYFPVLNDLVITGNIEGHGRGRCDSSGYGGSAAFAWRNGAVKSESRHLAAEKIDFSLELPDLPRWQTPPLQQFSCASLQLGSVGLSHLTAGYQVERGPALLLENFSADWCGGKIHTQALRLAPGQREMRAVVYCDGLKLPELLRTLGVAQAAGTGRIHGRLPLCVGPDGLALEPGFLYSEPGEKHQLRLDGLQDMLRGVPPESVQYAQIDLAAEALRDFTYDWVRLNFASVGEELQLQMQLDGRPNRPLPFSFDAAGNRLVRVDGGKASFQGIRLDLNSSLPMNRLLKFNRNLKQLFGGRQ